jgi:hypothetical protein
VRIVQVLGFLGDVLSASMEIPSASFLVASGRPGEEAASEDCAKLLEMRSPMSDATAFRGRQDSLPRNAAVLWEAKGMARLWGFLGAGLHCPQRILNQSRVRLIPAP